MVGQSTVAWAPEARSATPPAGILAALAPCLAVRAAALPGPETDRGQRPLIGGERVPSDHDVDLTPAWPCSRRPRPCEQGWRLGRTGTAAAGGRRHRLHAHRGR